MKNCNFIINKSSCSDLIQLHKKPLYPVLLYLREPAFQTVPNDPFDLIDAESEFEDAETDLVLDIGFKGSVAGH